MLPSADAVWVGEELARRFGLPSWQLAMSATDANRFVLRFARYLTGRPRIAVMDWCYHGTVDETLADPRRRPGRRRGPARSARRSTSPRRPPWCRSTTSTRSTGGSRVGDVACLLMEPALTNIGIVLPDAGYLDGVREVTRRHGVLLVIDETHTLCAGPGGCTAAWGLEPDFVVVGKPIGGGIPCAAYGMSAEVADRLLGPDARGTRSTSPGVGGTLTGNALATGRDPGHAVDLPARGGLRGRRPLAERFTDGVAGVIAEHGLPWHVQRLGCRAEYWFCPPPRDGAAAAAAVDEELEGFLHLWCLNRGVLLTPFHNMALFSPHHTEADVDRHTEVFGEAVAALTSGT